MLAFLAVTAMRAEAPKGLEFYAEHPAKFVPNLVEASLCQWGLGRSLPRHRAMLMGIHELLTPKSA